ncbi:hypothetical protein OE88DRAFT_1659131 [Heliocybe sulcata]|uniref:Uncharacterized protein n=1 Tax=Heliocybe sulcata TaxID=5364 RepID=A0A5C3N1A9_9AGAM|nr:hypothetical protein OE88DRAFT_1659131 [Heliocybe sulcata]
MSPSSNAPSTLVEKSLTANRKAKLPTAPPKNLVHPLFNPHQPRSQNPDPPKSQHAHHAVSHQGAGILFGDNVNL